MTQFSDEGTGTGLLLPACYLAPAAWYAAWLRQPQARVEVCNWYQKQQLSSRCWLRTAQGPLALTIHVERRSSKVPLREKRVSLQADWRGQHLKSWQNHYRHSPYFEFWEEDLIAYYRQDCEYLLEWIQSGHGMICCWLGLSPHLPTTAAYEDSATGEDLRNAFGAKPNQMPEAYVVAPYSQAYEGFVPGMSVLDLLFALGPEAKSWLLKTASG